MSKRSLAASRPTGPDWEALCLSLLEDLLEPALVLDEQGLVRAANEALARALQVDPQQLLDRPLTDYARFEAEAAGDQSLNESFRGIRGVLALGRDHPDGRHFTHRFKARPVGRAGGKLLFARLVASVERATRDGDPGAIALEYEISTRGDGFGSVVRMTTSSSSPKFSDGRCFERFRARGTPCADCPAIASDGEWPRVRVTRCESDPGAFHFLSAEPVGSDVVRVKVRRLPDGLFRRLADAKIDALSREASLSEREREVLRHLLLGAELQEIANTLAISVRTVKFHQSNVLQKLKVDSRSALTALLL